MRNKQAQAIRLADNQWLQIDIDPDSGDIRLDHTLMFGGKDYGSQVVLHDYAVTRLIQVLKEALEHKRSKAAK